MARYIYITTGLDVGFWAKDGVFMAGLGCGPKDYIYQTSLKKARFIAGEELLENNYRCVIHKFEAKPPYKYITTLE